MKQGNYVDLLEPNAYYTIESPRRARRQRINDNLLGDRRFCPTVRRTKILRDLEAADLPSRCRGIASRYAPALLRRALGYLYARETKSSFEIEHITPSSTRAERFVALLRLAQREDFCSKPRLVDLQNRIVDARFRNDGYRENQNYVGETVTVGNERIHFVSPRPEDLGALMEGLTAAHQRMTAGNVPAAIQAAAVSYGFVFLHPFEDGNRRIHRFLVHNILARRGFSPPEVMVPVSATMLKNPADYDASLEAFARPLMPLVEYTLDADGRLTVHNDTAIWYRYIDMTAQAEALFRFIDRTIDTELAEELAFLTRYDAARKAIQEIVDMPDRQIDLFIRFCSQNDGRLSGRKRASHFGLLSDEEVESMERAVQSAWGDRPGRRCPRRPAVVVLFGEPEPAIEIRPPEAGITCSSPRHREGCALSTRARRRRQPTLPARAASTSRRRPSRRQSGGAQRPQRGGHCSQSTLGRRRQRSNPRGGAL